MATEVSKSTFKLLGGVKAATIMVGAGAEIMGKGQSSARLQQPFSFSAVIDELTDELNSIQQELRECKKEARVLKTEQDTLGEVSKAQCVDIKRYLQKEISILDDLITKTSTR